MNPLFQVLFAYQNYPRNFPSELGEGVVWRQERVGAPRAKFDLALYVIPESLGWKGVWRYDRDLFTQATVEHWKESFQALLGHLVEQSERPLRDVALAGGAPALSGASLPPPTHSLVEQVARVAAARPQALAVKWSECRWTYGEFWQRVERAATGLRQAGVEAGDRVAVHLSRNAEALVVILASWRAGGVVVPLDPCYPEERRRFCLRQSEASYLVYAEGHELSGEAVRLVEVRSIMATEATQGELLPYPKLEESAYIIFTSGSTGRPKGVVVGQSHLAHYWGALHQSLDLQSTDRYLHTASFAFSSSFRQLVLPLSRGAAIVGAGEEHLSDPQQLFALVVEEEVTVMDLVPSHWRVCLQAVEQPLGRSKLRLLLSASEPLPSSIPKAALERFGGPEARFWNMYGQTETTGIVSVHGCRPEESGLRASVPLGRPIARTEIALLDPLGRPVPQGAIGEIHVGGPGLARYLQQDHHPELFATGDLGRWSGEGVLEYRGRKDFQLKVRGYRVEPGEVEAVLRSHPQVREATVSRRGSGLVAQVDANTRLDVGALKAHCRRWLPDYMVPAQIELQQKLPHRPGGKLKPPPFRQSEGKQTVVERLQAIWADVLDLPSVEPTQNFFELGGSSILSVEVVARARQEGLPVTLKQLFQHQSIGRLAACLTGEKEFSTGLLRVDPDEARAWGVSLLTGAGLSEEGARLVTEVQLEASMRGQPTHNLEDLPRYAHRLKAGILNPHPRITRVMDQPRFGVVDGDNAPGQWVASVAMNLAIEKAQRDGVGLVLARGSNHFGAAGYYPSLAAAQGLVGFATTNGPLILAPTGGITPTFGNNPMAFAIPTHRYHPVLLDIALSVAPRGKIGLQVARGEELPPGWILDSSGAPSTDLADLAAGLGVPIGGHKGYGLAFVMEILSGVMSGSKFGRDHGPGCRPLDLGHFFLVLDPSIFMNQDEFRKRVDSLIKQTRSSEFAANSSEILYPGEREWNAREQSVRLGVSVSKDLAAWIRSSSLQRDAWTER